MIEVDGWGARRWQTLAPLLLGVSVVVSIADSTAANASDLHAFVLGGAALDRPSTLYDAAYLDPAHNETMPFVYRPFAAMCSIRCTGCRSGWLRWAGEWALSPRCTSSSGSASR
jgi:hypothetical protein